MKRVIWLLAILGLSGYIAIVRTVPAHGEVLWTVQISTGIPGTHFINDEPQTSLMNGGIAYDLRYSTEPKVVEALKDMAEALNVAHETRRRWTQRDVIIIPQCGDPGNPATGFKNGHATCAQ